MSEFSKSFQKRQNLLKFLQIISKLRRNICSASVPFTNYMITARIPKDAGRLCLHRCLSVHGGGGGGGVPQHLVPGPFLASTPASSTREGVGRGVPKLLVVGPFCGGYPWTASTSTPSQDRGTPSPIYRNRTDVRRGRYAPCVHEGGLSCF